MEKKYKHVFVLNVGRSGSQTFAKACSHIGNYTSGHQTRSWEIGACSLDYPENHIEIDNKLSWLLGSLDEKFGEEPLYVHLIRERSKVVDSWNRRWDMSFSNVRAFTEGVLNRVPELLSEDERKEVAAQYHDAIQSNILLFLRDKPNVMTVNLETIKTDFRKFWDEIEAQGDLNAALAEFDHTYNSSISQAERMKKINRFQREIDEKVLTKKIKESDSAVAKTKLQLKLLWLRNFT